MAIGMVSHKAILTNVYDFRARKIGGHATTARCRFRYLKRFWGTRRTHKTTLRGRRREHSKVVFSILMPVAPAADYSLRDGYITQSESPALSGLFRIYRPCYTFKRRE